MSFLWPFLESSACFMHIVDSVSHPVNHFQFSCPDQKGRWRSGGTSYIVLRFAFEEIAFVFESKLIGMLSDNDSSVQCVILVGDQLWSASRTIF